MNEETGSEALIVAGAVACFRRPEFVSDAITYDVITPFAARGLFEAVHWTPAIRWQIERIEVINPIQTQWTILADTEPRGATKELDLVDVAYAIRARFELTKAAGSGENVAQHAAIFRRRARGSASFAPPISDGVISLATARLATRDEPRSAYAGSGAIDLGWMLYDRDLAGARPFFFRPVMIDGVIDLSSIDRASLAS